MFISPDKPPVVDMVSLRDNVFSFAAADFVAPWLLQLNHLNHLNRHVNTSLFLRHHQDQIQQEQLDKMASFNPMSLKAGWSHSQTAGQGLPEHGMQVYDGYYETQNPGTSMSTDDQPLTNTNNNNNNNTNRSSHSSRSSGTSGSSVSRYPSSTGTDVSAGPSYWTSLPFAAGTHTQHQAWEHHANHGLVNPAELYYGYSVNVHTSAIPQNVFNSANHGLQGLSLPSMANNTKDTNPNPDLKREYTPSRVLDGMVLDEETGSGVWGTDASPDGHARYDDPQGMELSGSDVTSSSWVDHAGDKDTVSPRMLRIRQTPTPSTSCESMHARFTLDANTPLATGTPAASSTATATAAVEVAHNQTPESTNATAEPAAKRPRKTLPDRTTTAHRPLLPANEMTRRQRSAELTQAQAEPRTQTTTSSSSHNSKLTRLRPQSRRTTTTTLGSGQSQTTPSAPTLTLPHHASSTSTSTTSSSTLGRGPPKSREPMELPDRASKDDFLVKQKQAGLTYKEIRRMGGFTEAESTLRGRYRTLTKSREARVRKPEWSEKDLRLLDAAVRALSCPPDVYTPSPSHHHNPYSTYHHQPSYTSHSPATGTGAPPTQSSKIPWKKVAEHMVAHGASYHFGNSTCRKRWDELVREQTALGKSVRRPFFDHTSPSPSSSASSFSTASPGLGGEGDEENGYEEFEGEEGFLGY
ncbi:uncharacterized protein C8A04DRAFT_29125 [Dichotomopilus funicola]|uniref:Myb-like domain-containing protein n=1 Tax=Dichotomopilus funicola TaxID=1934379 RepID=A0AAN6ZMJ3_9PEZI|nr:hypothetical protein C8A04DRAFT_29125 [Dichotomopilus funicola]